MTQLTLTPRAAVIYEPLQALPILSPHGHCDPSWFAEDAAFADPAALIITPDHYVFRMLYSQGVALDELGIGRPPGSADPRRVFQIFADHWHLFLGTPSRLWLTSMLRDGFGIADPLTPQNAMEIYDQIDAKLKTPAFRPRALFEAMKIDLLATTDAATDPLSYHQAIQSSTWGGRVIPTFRPDAVLDPSDPRFASELETLAELSNTDLSTFDRYLDALRNRRAFFKSLGATATDHAIEALTTCYLDQAEIEALFTKARNGSLNPDEAAGFYGHMLVEMAQMSCEDGLVMQLHMGSRRNTNPAIFETFGRDMGADIPVATNWVRGLEVLLNRCGNTPGFTLIAFTLDETTYARELAPMAGHWPCLKIGPPWWFHDSAAGIARYFDQVVETAGYQNLAGFNDDTRAFMSIPARHDLWRRCVAEHLAGQVNRGYFGMEDVAVLGRQLSYDLARDSYKITL
ncbi:MAG: glucuronate isomerase [Pseudomonadota bacterium]